MYKVNGLVVVTALGLSACGGSGGRSGTPVVISNGVFKDSNVSGLAYESGAQKGITDSKGAFKYEERADVSFSVGAVALGTGKGKAVMTPLNLVDNGKLSSPEVINRARFLMMLDKNNTPSDGIEISTKVQAIAKDWAAIDFAATDFPTQEVNDIVTQASVADDVVHKIPDADAASTHLKTTLLCANAGAYVGSYEGSEKGNIALVVNPATGEVNGSSYNPDNEVSVEVKTTTALDYDMALTFVSAEDSAKAFTGKLDSTDALSGTWKNTAEESATGTFSADRLGGSGDAVYRYTVTFIGGDKGVFSFDVDAGNNIKGTSYSISSKKESAITGNLAGEKLTATSADGTKIDGALNLETLALEGVWSNVGSLQAGSYTGGGCRLN